MTKNVPRQDAEKPAEKKPQYQEKTLNDDLVKVRCRNDGVACWYIGEFGRMPMVLCNKHVIELRAKGWKVRYQIEGDNPPPLADELMGKQE